MTVPVPEDGVGDEDEDKLATAHPLKGEPEDVLRTLEAAAVMLP